MVEGFEKTEKVETGFFLRIFWYGAAKPAVVTKVTVEQREAEQVVTRGNAGKQRYGEDEHGSEPP